MPDYLSPLHSRKQNHNKNVFHSVIMLHFIYEMARSLLIRAKEAITIKSKMS